MAGRHEEWLRRLAVRAYRGGILPHRRQLLAATAFTFVTCVSLLFLGTFLPFPSPGEPMLYDPTDWSLLFGSRPSSAPPPVPTPGAAPIGGLSAVQPTVTYLLYRARPGDTMGNIATKLGVSVDTLSSMNRVQGRGVHTIMVGEVLKVPSQDGIPVTLNGDFDKLCADNKVTPDEVLSANGITRADLHDGLALFLPGVQHTGIDLWKSIGAFVARPLGGWESSPFGWREDPITGVRSFHTGVDLAAPMGSPIRSATIGIVVAAEFNAMLGNYVEIRFNKEFSYVYGHMSAIRTRVGARVEQGQLIGLVGDTGYATGPHVHFEIRQWGRPVNPLLFVPGLR